MLLFLAPGIAGFTENSWEGYVGAEYVETDLNRRKVIDKRKISWTWDGQNLPTGGI